MKTYTEPQQEVIAEHTLRLDVNHTRERNLRFLYIGLGIGVVVFMTGVVLLLTQ
jgi:hypothetical protein